MPISFYAIILLLVIIFLTYRFFRKKPLTQPEEKKEKKILEENVRFYQELSETEKERFLQSVRNFLEDTRVTGVNIQAEDLDKVLVAAAAIIPIFAFKDWKYNNIREVLIYPESFGDGFTQTGEDRHMLGVVGNGPLQNVMVLSRHDLRQGFFNETDKSNLAIHEFVHLVDKHDGEVDGLPETLLRRKYVVPWLKKIREKIQEIKEGDSDINPYGSTNDAEFFAVASEYFFERPDLMEEKHPELFALLQKIFTPNKAAD